MRDRRNVRAMEQARLERAMAMFAGAAALVLAVTLTAACSSPRRSTPNTELAATAEPSGVARTPGHRGGGLPFTSPVDLAHHFNVGVFAPEGIPLHGGVTAETDASGALTNYGMWLFNGYGALYVGGKAPATAAEFR